MNTLGLVFIFLLVASIITTAILVYVFYIHPSSVSVVPTTSSTTPTTSTTTIAPLIQTSPIVKISPPPQPPQPPSKTSSIVQPKPPPSQKNSSPSIPSSPGTLTADGEPADEVARTGSALTIINTFRATIGKPPMKYYTEGTDCANKCAEYDNTNGFHASTKSGGGGGVPCPGRNAQCEGNNQQSQKEIIQLYINEGSGGGHYDIIAGQSAKISSGVFPKGNGRYFFTHNFYR